VGVAAGKDFVLILIKSTDAQRLNLKSFDCPNLFFTRPLSPRFYIFWAWVWYIWHINCRCGFGINLRFIGSAPEVVVSLFSLRWEGC